jgi:hypothetical protein
MLGACLKTYPLGFFKRLFQLWISAQDVPMFFNNVVELFTKWGVLMAALNALVRRAGRFGREAVILGHIFTTFPCVLQPFLWVTPLSETLIQLGGLFDIVTPCTTNGEVIF